MAGRKNPGRAGVGAANRLHARLAALARPAGGFVSQPEPKTIGSFARGRQLTGGNFLFAGFLIESKAAPFGGGETVSFRIGCTLGEPGR